MLLIENIGIQKMKDESYALFNPFTMHPLFVKKSDYSEFERDKDRFIKKWKEKLVKHDLLVENSNMVLDYKKKLQQRINQFEENIDCVYIIPTSACNLKCSYCFVYNNENNVNDSTVMTEKIAEKFINSYTAYVKKKKLSKVYIQFYGGEPTLNWKVIVKIVEGLSENLVDTEIDFSIISNGTTNYNKYITFLKKHEISLGISADGPIHVNSLQRIVNKPISYYNKLIDNINLLKKNDINIALSITITEHTLLNQEEVIKWLKRMDIKSSNYNLLHFRNEDSEYCSSYYKRASFFLIKSFEELSPLGIYDDRILRKIRSFVHDEFKFADCIAGYEKQITINHKGEYVVCQCNFLEPSKVIGNINKDSFEVIDNFVGKNNSYKAKIPINNVECDDCPYIYLCGGGCLENANFDILGKDSGYCEHTKVIQEWLIEKMYETNFLCKKV